MLSLSALKFFPCQGGDPRTIKSDSKTSSEFFHSDASSLKEGTFFSEVMGFLNAIVAGHVAFAGIKPNSLRAMRRLSEF
jgi:hypothetical protein